jgi:hypothetical protein
MKIQKEVIIIGAGLTGALTASYIKARFPQYRIKMIHTSTLPPYQGAQGVTSELYDYFYNLYRTNIGRAVKIENLLNQSQGTFRVGTMYQEWGQAPYLHTVLPPYKDHYAELISKRHFPQDFTPSVLWQNQIPTQWFTELGNRLWRSFHLRTSTLIELFLSDLPFYQIQIIDDKITDCKKNNKGEITHVIGEDKIYHGDIFLDCSGEHRVLINQFDTSYFHSWEDQLINNQTITFTTPPTFNLWTLAERIPEGYHFTVPLRDQDEHTYVFSDKFPGEITSKAKAKYGISSTFKQGYMAASWNKNCIALGEASFCIESLDSPFVGTLLKQLDLMSKFLPSQDRITYTQHYECLMHNIFTFTTASYQTQKDDSAYWKHVENIKPNYMLQSLLDIAQLRLLTSLDFPSSCRMFGHEDFIIKFYALDLFNHENIKKEYAGIVPWKQWNATALLTRHYRRQKSLPSMSHEEILKGIKDK